MLMVYARVSVFSVVLKLTSFSFEVLLIELRAVKGVIFKQRHENVSETEAD